MSYLKELVKKALPTGESYDDWIVHVGHNRIWTYTVPTRRE